MPNDEPTVLPSGPFSGPEEFASLIRQAIDAAAREGWREWTWSDPDFTDWPLGERVVAEAMQQWSSAGRKLTLVAENYGIFERHHARFVYWRRMWGHIVDARVCRGAGLPAVPSAIWTPTWAVRRLDIERSRGHSGTDAVARRALREQLDECVRNSREGFPITTLGL